MYCFCVTVYCDYLINFIVLKVIYLLFLCNNNLLQYVAMRLDIFVLAIIFPENIYCFCVTINYNSLIKLIVLSFLLV
jgi:hypothetical protein